MKKDIALDKQFEDSNGFKRIDAVLASAGVMSYKMKDGSVKRGLMEPSSLEQSLDHFSALPLTNNHPSVGLITPENYKELGVGYVDSKGLRFEDGKVMGSVVVASDDGIEAVESGKNDVSLGYKETKVFTPGVFVDSHNVMGQGAGKEYEYDFVKTNIDLNHLALVDEGRSKVAALVFDHDDFSKSENETIKLKEIKNVTTEVSGSSNKNIQKDNHTIMTDTNTLKSIVINDSVIEVAVDSADAVLALKQTAADTQLALDAANTQVEELTAANATLVADAAEFETVKGELEALKALSTDSTNEVVSLDADEISTEAAARLAAWTLVNELSTDSVDFVATNTALDTKRAFIADNYEVENVADATEQFLDGMIQILSKSSKKTVTNFVADTAVEAPATAPATVKSTATATVDFNDGFGISLN